MHDQQPPDAVASPRRSRGLSNAIRKMLAGLAVLLVVWMIGVVGYLIAGWRLDDALFMVVITIFGVGYGEVRPVDTWQLRTLTGFVIVAGYGAVIYAMGGFISMVVDGEINQAFGARKMTKTIDRLERHTIICGFGRMGTSLAHELAAAGRPFVAIDPDPDAAERARAEDWPFIGGDASDEQVLEAAGIHRASTLATVLSDDATNVFITVTARAMCDEIMIIARGEDRRTESKLLNCGANRVIMPTDIGASKMSQLIVRPSAEEMLDRMTGSTSDADLVHLGLEFDEIELESTSPWANRTLGELEVRGAHGYLVIGIRGTDGQMVMHPPTDHMLNIGDRVIVLGYHDDIPSLGTRVAPRTVTYRGVTSEI